MHAAPAVWEEEVDFKLAAISPEQTAAGQFTSSVNNAPALGREPPSSLFSATMDGHPSLETVATGGATPDALIMARGGLKSVVQWNHLLPSSASTHPPPPSPPPAAERGPACLINGSPLEARGSSAAHTDTLNEPRLIMFSTTTLQLMMSCDKKNLHTVCQIYKAARTPGSVL